jgi:hypothetical protein
VPAPLPQKFAIEGGFLMLWKLALVAALALSAVLLGGCGPSAPVVLDAAICGGTAPGSGLEFAFDHNDATVWSSFQTGEEVAGVAYIGRSYASPVLLTYMTFVQPDEAARVPKISLEYSEDGAIWTQWFLLSCNFYCYTFANFVHAGSAHHFWRVVAKAPPSATGSAWSVGELTFEVEPE